MDPLAPTSLLPHDIVRVRLPGRPQPTAARLLLAIPGEHRAIIEHPYLFGVEGAEREDSLRKGGGDSRRPFFTFTAHGQP